MTQKEILEELRKLTPSERLTVVETTLHMIREDLNQNNQPGGYTERQQQLASAAKALLPDYSADGEMTIFTTLDSEDFHAQG